MNIQIQPVQAYLEQSRAFLNANIKGNPDTTGEDHSRLPGTFLFAFVAQAYIFSFLAVQAFASEQLWLIWNQDDKPLQKKYPNASGFEHLLRSDLKELKDQLKMLAEILKIEKVHSKNPNLWDDFLRVVKVTRDMLSHPTPEPEKFNNIIGHALTEKDWIYPSEVSKKIISHFIESTRSEKPVWLDENKLIRIPTVEVSPQ